MSFRAIKATKMDIFDPRCESPQSVLASPEIIDFVDQEDLTSEILSSLFKSGDDENNKSYFHSNTKDESLLGLQQLLSMEHNAGLSDSILQIISNSIIQNSTTSQTFTKAVTLSHLKEIVFSIKNDIYPLNENFGELEKAELASILDLVGVSAQENPFPDLHTTRCDTPKDSIVYGMGGLPLFRYQGATVEFKILSNTSSNQRYALSTKLKEAIYGCVREALVLEPSDKLDSDPIWDEDRENKVAIKVVSKTLLHTKSHLDEDPYREFKCHAYITNRIACSRQATKTAIKGDTSRILPMLDCLEDDDNYYLVMPLLKVDLYDIIEKHGAIPESKVFNMLEDILSGLEVTHSLGIAHHDISLENLMLDQFGHVTIIDYGMAVKVPLVVGGDGTSVKLKSQAGWPCRCGKALYHSPETIDAGFGKPAFDALKVDIWSLGVVLFLLLTGVPPWDVQEGPSFSDTRFKWVTGGKITNLLSRWGIGGNLSSDAIELLQALLSRNPSDRPSISEIRKFRWFMQGGNTA